MAGLAEKLGLQSAERDPATGGPALDDDETVLHKFERLQLVLGAGVDQGEGNLFITEWRVFWLSAAPGGAALAVDFPAIAMHAVATDEESGNRPCLYLQLDSGEEGGEQQDEEEEGEGGEAPLPEVRLVPADAPQLDALFQAFCEGAERNPDYDDEDSEEGEGAGFFYDEDAALAGAAAAALGVGDVDELVGQDPGRFEDAEGDEFEEFEAQQAQQQARQPNGSS